MGIVSKIRPGKFAFGVALAALATSSLSGAAVGKDKDDGDDSSAKFAWPPNIYLDLRTTYATIPANTLAIGLGNASFSTAFPVLATLSSLPSLPSGPLPALPTLSSPASRSIGVDVPLTVDLSDRVSVYGGFSATTSRTDMTDWSNFTVSAWMVGFQADVYQQNGGAIPTITLQSTVTKSVPDAPLATVSLNTILEFDYALNEDETRGLLAGIQHTRIDVETPFVTVSPNIIGYVGGYYQWDNDWKLTGRVRRSIVRRRAASEPDAVPALYPADREARPRPDGRQRQPAVRRHRRDRVGVEAVLPADDPDAALRGTKLASGEGI